MPPFLPRKRSTPPASSRPTPSKRAKLADALDADATNHVPFLKNSRTFSLGSDDSVSDSSLSDVESDQFEDVNLDAAHAGAATIAGLVGDEDAGGDQEDDEDVEWEDAAAVTTVDETPACASMPNGSIQITLRNDDDDVVDYGTSAKVGSGKKGPSKREKQVRIITHQLHVQFLLWHNAVRNHWIGDKKTQEILVGQLPPQISKEVEKWKRASGLIGTEAAKSMGSQGKKLRKSRQEHDRNQRDWGKPSQRLEVGKPDMSHGDPLISLLKVLSAYWKKRFAITAPGLRKRGYGTKHGLKQDIASWRNDEHDPERHGEQIQGLAGFRKMAATCEGSRDAGAQLFTSLLRGLGIEARLVASLQPAGYGWTKAEQSVPKKLAKIPTMEISSEETEIEKSRMHHSAKMRSKLAKKSGGARQGLANTHSGIIGFDTDHDERSEGEDTEDDESVVDVTPSMPKQRKPMYDRDLVFPVYWTEAVSPITSIILPVSPLVLQSPVATTPEILSTFEPRGVKAEKGRQVIAYIVAYSPDGTAKDVTVRYLRKRILPGKTKGFRNPVAKVPIYDRTGRVQRYTDYDWFGAILRPYVRSDKMRTRVDDIEDTTDLTPQQPENKNEGGDADTLQSLKSSADFCLERFLRREEALRPGAQQVRIFVSGKGDKCKEEPVYRRADVERCLTAESWHKEGRRPKLGEIPMKMVPVRAVTLTRKREAEEHERQYGEKQTQGLYSWDQTEWIIPPPIENGIIPKNSYGNMDCFVPSMVPRGAVHIPLRGTVRICKKLDIDFAEAVTGFEFGNKRAVPVCTGVVVAEDNERLVKDAWHEWNAEQRRKEETKMEKLVLDLWRKFILGLRIRERVQDMYGEEIGVLPDAPTGLTPEDAIAVDDDDCRNFGADGGGSVSRGEEEEMGGGFLLPHEDEVESMGDLIIDDQMKSSQQSIEEDKTSQNDLSEPSTITSWTEETSAARYKESDDDHEDYDTDTVLHELPARPHRRAHHRKEHLKTPLGTDKPEMEEANESDAESTSSSESTAESTSSRGQNSNSKAEESDEAYKPLSARTRARDQVAKKVSAMPRETSVAKPIVSRGKRTIQRSRDESQCSSRFKTQPTTNSASGTSVTSKRGRGRPRKSESTVAAVPALIDDDSDNTEGTRKSRPKAAATGRKTRRAAARANKSKALPRKDSTVVTSPYFDE